MNDESKKPRGPKSEFWDPSLGPGVKKNPGWPVKVWAILYDEIMKKILNRMAMEPLFAKSIFALLNLPIDGLLSEAKVKALMTRMATDRDFKKQVFELLKKP